MLSQKISVLPKQKFINQSLELNLFFLRIIKEHLIFLQASLTPKDKPLALQAELFKNDFTKLFKRALLLSEGILDAKALEACDLVTKYTLDAEKATQAATGVFIDSSLTRLQTSLIPAKTPKSIASLEDQVYRLNERIIDSINTVIKVKSKIVSDVLCCKLFTHAYPSLLEHVLREAVYYKELLIKLQNGKDVKLRENIIKEQQFWNEIMSEHALFIRGLLDPAEDELFEIANSFGKKFEKLRKEACETHQSIHDISVLTANTAKSVTELRDFKAQATIGLIDCKIKSIIFPLLADHVLREANHYLKILSPNTCKI